ncbi:MAG: M20/M25/M40 family metallo-hydrolase [Rickettsiales bacterium]|jgi:acetylornithine deacetylase/succinyl-diaminopimelate desuccinylase-like protein|nr:M20/M25/M40 family metallo-hydrolase [Rickettsiales bacterium]
MLHLIRDLVRVPSLSDSFEAVAKALDLCREFLPRNLGITTTEFIKNGHRSLIFSNAGGLEFDVISSCHIDVAPAQTYEMKIDRGKIFGRGVFDMKSFVVSSLANLRELAIDGRNIRYAVVLTSDEEIGGENGMRYLVETVELKTHLVLDSDSGKNINSIVRENLGAITIELIGKKQSVIQTILNIKNKFVGYHCENYGNEMDINFADGNILETIRNCLDNEVTFRTLMLNAYARHDISNGYHQLYRQIMEKNGVTAEYITTSGTNDSRYFFEKGVTLISHQATGGGNHRETEWLELESFYKFNRIQREFLMTLDKLFFPPSL